MLYLLSIFHRTYYINTDKVRVKKAKLDDVKSLTKYWRQSSVDYINIISEELEGGDDVYDSDGNEEDD